MYGTSNTPSDFKKLVKKVLPEAQIEETRISQQNARYKVSFVYLFTEKSTTLRVRYFAGDVIVELFQGSTVNFSKANLSLGELTRLGVAIENAKTIVEAFYSINQRSLA